LRYTEESVILKLERERESTFKIEDREKEFKRDRLRDTGREIQCDRVREREREIR